jgi:heme-degrading monooxygenase HmoA
VHAKVVTIQIRPGKLEGAMAIYRDAVLPALSEQRGFRGTQLLTDATSGKGLMLTLWETEADMTALEVSGAFQVLLAKFQSVLGAPATREHYEVSLTA